MIRGLGVAVGFLTRFPLGVAGPITDGDLGRSTGFFPIVGLGLGLVVAGLGYLLAGLMPSLMVAVLLVALLAVVTGGLHLDGVADLFDGLGGGRGSRERTLDIMRDSRIGAHGAAALTLVLVAKIAAVAALVDRRDFAGLVVSPTLARWVITVQIVGFPYARTQGLGRAFKTEAGGLQVVIATATATAVVLVVGLVMANKGIGPFKAAAVALAVAIAIGIALRRRLDGLTGDVYGATVELCEIAALFTAAVS